MYIYTHTSLLTLYRMQIVAPCVCPELSILAATVPAGHPPEQSVWLKRDYEGEEGGRTKERRERRVVDVEQKWKDGRGIHLSEVD